MEAHDCCKALRSSGSEGSVSNIPTAMNGCNDVLADRKNFKQQFGYEACCYINGVL